MSEELRIEQTDRGFNLAKFKDSYDQECSLQESSAASEPKIWLGVHENRMHLTQAMAAHLIPAMEYFVETGTLPEPDRASTMNMFEHPLSWYANQDGEAEPLIMTAPSGTGKSSPLSTGPIFPTMVYPRIMTQNPQGEVIVGEVETGGLETPEENVLIPEYLEPVGLFTVVDHATLIALQTEGRAPLQPTINEAGEIICWGAYVDITDLEARAD